MDNDRAPPCLSLLVIPAKAGIQLLAPDVEASLRAGSRLSPGWRA